MDLILNAPIWLVVILAVVAAAMLFSGLRSGQENIRKAAYVLLLVTLVLVGLKWTIPTDEKKVEKTTRTLLAAIASGDWATADPLLKHASMFTWQGDALIAQAKTAARDSNLASIRINTLDVKRDPQVILVHTSVTTTHTGRSYDTVPSSWTFEYQKRGKEWVLIRLVPTKIALFQGNDVESLIHAVPP